MEKMLSIPEIATEMVEKTLMETSDNNSRTLFVVGSKSSGKTSLLYTFLDKNETPRETLVLEYSFGRKSNQKQGIEKTVCHVWEYGGKLNLLKNVLTSIPMHGVHIYCIIIDLSKVKSIWSTLELCLQSYSELEKTPEVIIIGGKYDIFKDYDNEIKKFICTTLRSVSLIYSAHLLFYSSKDPYLVKRGKEILHNMCFGNFSSFKEKNTNFGKPLMVAKGADSWENIGVPKSTIEEVKMRHLSRIPLQPEVTETDVDSGLKLMRSHPETAIDVKVALKYEELRNLTSLDISIDDYLAGIKS
ncbi:cytoplasmic dynein 2 light intermediate chain 1 [Plodia interpunctella]|uniref:cytoplasmic dynein 2 light intermediate chain 1 n=1 Tax=Plodia interpunctella TaxID=58824 RepID=UPI0023686B7E|nr:cytoplasmic dynein 2 light intermediate chain 1 [Plodia interpunctella]